MNETDFERLWPLVEAQSRVAALGVHGPAHWRRVERNGLLLAGRTGANVEVVRFFALFHDSRREDDGTDSGHGARGAELATSLRSDGVFALPDAEFTLLRLACTWHTDGLHHEDPTIGTCWDADRLDLGRIGVIPHLRFMSTAFGREIAAAGSIQPFLAPAEGTDAPTRRPPV